MKVRYFMAKGGLAAVGGGLRNGWFVPKGEARDSRGGRVWIWLPVCPLQALFAGAEGEDWVAPASVVLHFERQQK
jgi:hypothetical protein